MSYGTGAYGSFGAGLPIPGASTDNRPTIVSSRRIDPKKKDYVFEDDGTGNYDGMDDIYQRVILLVAFELKHPKLIGVDYEADMTQRIRKALLPLVREKSIKIKSIEITKGTSGNYYHHVRFIVLAVNREASITL